MNKLTFIEFILVGAIVLIQTGIAIKTFLKIRKFKTLIPELEFFKIRKYDIPLDDLRRIDPRTILKNISNYEYRTVNQEQPMQAVRVGDSTTPDLFEQNGHEYEQDEFLNEVSLINPKEWTNKIFDNILTSTNIYLLRNSGAVADFNLVKDIVERNVETEDDEITQVTSVPLYLGLMGTMVGIVVGLINLFLVSKSETDFDPQPFLGGVSIAMFASFWGLFCSVGNANFNYKTAKRNLEKSKNDFYTFVQTELLPILNQNISSSIHSLHQNLGNFNDKFNANLVQLKGMLNQNHDALIAQERILTTLEKMDLTEFAKANVVVLQELKIGTEQLGKFNQYIGNLNNFATGTNVLSESFEKMLSRVNNFQGLAEKLDTRVEESNQLVMFLTSHFSQLQLSGDQMKESVTKVEDVLVKSLRLLEEHTEAKIKAIKEITIKEEDMMSKALADNRNNLTKLSILEDVNKNILEFKNIFSDQMDEFKSEISNLNKTSSEIANKLDVLNNSNLITRVRKRINGFFSKKY